MQVQEITSLLDKTNAKLIVLLCHQNADPDAICSAFAFSKFLQGLRPKLKVEIAAAHGISRLSKFILKSLPLTLTTQSHIEEAEIIALLDTNTIQRFQEE